MSEAEAIQGALAGFWAATGSASLPEFRVAGAAEDRSAFRIALAASAASGAVLAAVAELMGTEAGPIDPSLALAGFSSHVKLDGRAPPTWAPLSGCYRSADERFVQLHCNFPHHAAGVAKLLGVPAERSAFESAVLRWRAEELEESLIEDGMICAAYRTIDEWRRHPQAAAIDGYPLASVTPLRGSDTVAPAAETSPLSRVRVLDCSRVLAGPVAGQTLAHLGADVMRVGASHLPHIEACLMVTGTGKRNAFVDLRTREGRAAFTELVRGADMVLDAYRPGALAGHGFGAEEIAQINPRASVVQISAFDWTGPWRGRRGYDSIVQSTTGIAMEGARWCGSDEPVHLPVQALDHATGLFAAAAAIRALHRRREGSGTSCTRLSLLRTRDWLVGLGAPGPFERSTVTPVANQLAVIESDFGALQMVKPFIGQWRSGPRRLGTSPPSW